MTWQAEPASTVRSPPIRSAMKPQKLAADKAEAQQHDNIALPPGDGNPDIAAKRHQMPLPHSHRNAAQKAREAQRRERPPRPQPEDRSAERLMLAPYGTCCPRERAENYERDGDDHDRRKNRVDLHRVSLSEPFDRAAE